MDNVVHTEAEPRQRGIYSRVYDFFSSVKLAVVVFFLLAIGSILGTVIEQGLDPQEYVARFGEKKYYWLTLFSLTNVYHSWWFTSLLALIAINLAVCLSKRLPSIWRAYYIVDCDFTHNLVQNLKNSTVIKFQGNTEEAKQKIREKRALQTFTPEQNKKRADAIRGVPSQLKGRLRPELAEKLKGKQTAISIECSFRNKDTGEIFTEPSIIKMAIRLSIPAHTLRKIRLNLKTKINNYEYIE